MDRVSDVLARSGRWFSCLYAGNSKDKKSVCAAISQSISFFKHFI